MKRYLVVIAALSAFLIGVIALAQSTTPPPQSEQQPAIIQTPFGSIPNPRLQQQRDAELQQLVSQLTLQRGGGGRGTPPGIGANNGAWWTNAALVDRLGLSDDQKARIERAFENHRVDLATRSETLSKEEAQLAKLLEADTVDRSAVFTQIDRVTQARAELERVNSTMTLEMREVLTRAQWLQLQPSQRVRVGANVMANNLISKADPVAPPGSQGLVTLEAEISKEGTVENVRVISGGDPTLAQAATNAVRQWRYKPTLLNGEAVPVVTTINVAFGSATVPTAPGPGQRRGPAQR